MLVAAVGLALLSLPLLVTDTIPRLFVVVLVLGLRRRALHDQRLHARRARGPAVQRVGAAMTLLAGATGIGYAVGSAVAGRLADVHGHDGRVLGHRGVRASAPAVLAAAAQPLLRRIGGPDQRPGPTPAPTDGAVLPLP